MWRGLARFPLPLVFAIAMGVGTTMYLVLQINIAGIFASWDPRYAAFNGTHVYQTSPMPATLYKTLYLGYGTAYFRDPVNVYYLRKVYAGGEDIDLGRYLPVVLVVESGSLPTNTYITWTDPYSGRTRKLYLVSGANRGYVIGEYHWYGSLSVAGIPVYYRVVDNFVYIYPMEWSAFNPSEGCPILFNSGFYGRWHDMYAILDNMVHDCISGSSFSVPVGWELVASSATMVELKPSPTHYLVTVNVGNSRVTIMLSYWYAVNRDPGFFAVKVGSD